MKHSSVILISVVFTLVALSVNAATWGPSKPLQEGVDKTAELNKYYDLLSRSPNEEISRNIFKELWQVWMLAPNEDAAERLNQAMRARGGYEFDAAINILDTLISDYPNFEQAFAERSYVNFLKKDYSSSLTDCEKVLEFDEYHLGCLSGMARILIRHQSRYKAGKSLLDSAVAIHPYIFERVLYKEIPAAFL